jgi:prophage DNA circulation protein
MSRLELRPGTFRGVPFKIEEHSHPLGRRTALHEFPGRDDPYVEDLGRKTRRHTLDLFVVGRDYVAERDALREALEAKGPGELVHPYLGRMTVQVEEATLRESTKDGGLARFSVTFVEIDRTRDFFTPVVEPDTLKNVDLRASAAAAAVQSTFASAWDVAKQAPSVAAAGQSLLEKWTERVRELQNRVPKIPAAVFSAIAAIRALSNTSSTLIRSPFNLAAQAIALLGDVRDWVQQPLDALRLYQDLSLFGDGLANVLGTTASKQRRRTNQAAFVSLAEVAAVIEGARTTALIAYPTTTDARRVRDTWSDALDAQMAAAPSDAVYSALQALRAAMLDDLNRRAGGAPLETAATWRTEAGQMPDLVVLTPAATLPTLVLAHSLYGTASLTERADELAARNRIVHPGFVPGGQALMVASA